MTSNPHQEAEPGAREILDRTSRSFALSIRALPRGMRRPVELAYLLARAGDTLADTGTLGEDERLARLGALRAALRDGSAPEGASTWAFRGDGDDVARAEAALVRGLPGLFDRLAELPEADRRDATSVVDRLVATMEVELELFRGATLEAPRCLPDGETLTGYTEGIAGCVGAFWTSLVARHVGCWSPGEQRALEVAGRRYGRGLQLVNVLRDLPRDLRRGRVFLPADELAAAGLEPRDLRGPSPPPPLARLLERWAARSRRGLLTGLAYAARVPLSVPGVRIASALPAAIGLRTLDALRDAPSRLDPARPVRLARARTWGLVAGAALLALLPRGPVRLAPRRRAETATGQRQRRTSRVC